MAPACGSTERLQEFAGGARERKPVNPRCGRVRGFSLSQELAWVTAAFATMLGPFPAMICSGAVETARGSAAGVAAAGDAFRPVPSPLLAALSRAGAGTEGLTSIEGPAAGSNASSRKSVIAKPVGSSGASAMSARPCTQI